MDGKCYKILIVDDEEPVRRALERLVKRFDELKVDTKTAENAKAALEELEKQDFDVVLSDFKMPGMDGIEFLTKVKEGYPLASRILITGFADINIAMEAINKSEVHSYIEKPWDDDDLKQCILRAVTRKKIEVKSQKRRKPLSQLDQLLQSEDGKSLINALLEMENTQVRVHTIIERTEDDFPEVEDIDFKLKVLSDKKLVKQVKEPPILLKCPSCQSYDYRQAPICPYCSSEDLEKGEAIEHYKCAKVNFYHKFVSGEKMICPHCKGELKQLGVDYQKVSNWVHCKECNEYCGEPNLQFFCNDCNTGFKPNQAVWEKENKLIIDKKRLRDLLKREYIISEIETTFEHKDLYVARNSEIVYKDDKKRFDIVVYRDRSDISDVEKAPVFISDVHLVSKGILSKKIEKFSNKIEGLPYENIFLIVVPFLSKGSKDTCKKLNVKYLEISDTGAVGKVIGKTLPMFPDIEDIEESQEEMVQSEICET